MLSPRRGGASGAQVRKRIVRATLSSATLAGAIAGALLAGPAYATDFLVGTDAQLRSAITSTGNGDRIIFSNNITLVADLPAVQTNVTIIGNNNTLSGNNQFRGLFIGAWTPGTATQVAVTVAIQDLVIANAKAQGGNGGFGGGGGAGLGGAIFVANLANVSASNVTLSSNSAQGGGGSLAFGSFNGGGGGGMGGVGGGGGMGRMGGVPGTTASRRLQAVLLGGAAGVFVTPDQLDVPLTFEGTRAIGAALGSGVVMAFDDTVDLRQALRRIAQFFRDESCGQCVPCRVGAVRQEEVLHRLARDRPLGSVGQELALLAELGQVMRDASICGLGQTASSAVESAVAKFPIFEEKR
jgi:hypothetical protein